MNTRTYINLMQSLDHYTYYRNCAIDFNSRYNTTISKNIVDFCDNNISMIKGFIESINAKYPEKVKKFQKVN